MTETTRRDIMMALAATGLWPAAALAQTGAGTPRRRGAAASSAPALGKPESFSWEALQQRAAALARAPYRAPAKVAAAEAIDYDAVGSISYRPERTLAGGIRLFPLGRYAPTPVAIHVVERGQARAVDFAADLFKTESGHHAALGIAGFRAVSSDGKSDWMAFIGASYFRTAGSQDQYGLSARGIAIDTGIDGKEEFPAFTAFWIEATGAQSYTVYALLDGPSVTGAYRFVCRYTDGTDGGVVQDVSSTITLRKDVARLGIAPATSMFWYGEGNRAAAIDWRPEIHDSDGLAMATGAGERIWRPLANPATPTLDSFQDDNPRGFGLIQRDRAFDHYQDDGAFYDRRANLWIEPKGDWGKGAVTLYAFPTASETVDNIAAFWVPAVPATAGKTMQFDYRLTWSSRDPSVAQPAHAVENWRGSAGRPGAEPTPGARKVVVDFVGATLAGLDRSSGVTVQADVSRGRVLASAAYPVVGQPNRWRVTLDVAPERGVLADVRLFLKRGGQSLSETVLTQVG